MLLLGNAKFCITAYGEKGLRLFHAILVLSIFSFICQCTRIVGAYNVCEFKKKRGKLYDFQFLLYGGSRAKKVKINFYKNFYICDFSEHTSILALVLPTTCVNFRKIKRGKKLANTRNAIFWKNGRKIG